MGSRVHNQQGAALVTVLLFMTLTFILITGMLAVTGNEVVISGIQRDSTRALDYAQAGIQEAVRRMEQGRPYLQGFPSSLNPTNPCVPGQAGHICVSVIRRFTGTNAAYQEIQADATVGRARRRLSFLVLQQIITFPPNITFAASVIEQGSAQIICGDAYARTFIQYKEYPIQAADCTEPPSITYAGWRISKVAPSPVANCYDNPNCVSANNTPPDPPYENEQVTRWYPAHRRTENETTSDGADIKAQTKKCPAGGGGTLPTTTIPGVLASAPTDCATDPACALDPYYGYHPVYGFEPDDPDGGGPAQNQAVNFMLPCGLPYKLVAQTFQAEDGSLRTRLFRTIIFEQWFANYWRFDQGRMKMVKRNGSACIPTADLYCLPGDVEPNLFDNPKLGAVPPFPSIESVESNFNCRVNGGGTISSLPISCLEPTGMTTDMGCYAAKMTCTPAVDRPVSLALDGGDYSINANLQGHGTIVVDGNLTVNGNFEYWGTIIVKGTLTLGAGSATIHGGLVADSTLKISGNINVEGGGTVTNVPTGQSIVIGKGWWER